VAKYDAEQKQKFLDLVKAGKSVKEAAAEAGISWATAIKLRMAENKKNSPSSPAPESSGQGENLSEGSVPPPGDGDGGAKEGAGARGAAGARTALVDGDEVPVDEVDEDGEKKEDASGEEKPSFEIDPAKLLVDLCKMFTWGMTRGYARRYKVEVTPKLREELHWTNEEEAELMEYAPAVAAAMPGILLMLGPWVGPIIFAWTLYHITAARCEMVKSKAATKPGEEKKPDEETIIEEDPLPNGYRPRRAETPGTMEDLARSSFWAKKN
jgi:hypothetical protein